MKNEQQIEAYKKMAKEAASIGMEARIKANLEKTCDKYKGRCNEGFEGGSMKTKKTFNQIVNDVWTWFVAIVALVLILVYCVAVACAIAKLIHG